LTSLRLSGALGTLAFVNLTISFAYQWYVVTTLGASSETDALVAAMVVPQLVLAIFSGTLTQVLVPLLATLDSRELRDAGWGFTLGVGGGFAGLSLGLIIVASIWVPWIVPGFSTAQVGLTVELAVIQLAGMVFMAIGAVLSAVSHARGKFVRVEVSGLVASASSLLFLAWGLPRMGIVAGAWGLFLRPLVQSVLLSSVLGPACWPDWRRVPWREAGRRLKPLLLGTSYYKTDPLVDRVLTSLAVPGSMTLLNLSQQLYAATGTVLGKALAAPMIPMQARLAVRGEWREFRKVLLQRLIVLACLTLGGWLLLILVGKDLLPLLFAGRLTSVETHQLWWLLVLLGGMLVGGSLGTITSGAFYAKGETRIPTRLGVITYTGYVPVKILVFWKFGLPGLALSISGFYLLNLLLQIRYLDLDPRSMDTNADR